MLVDSTARDRVGANALTAQLPVYVDINSTSVATLKALTTTGVRVSAGTCLGASTSVGVGMGVSVWMWVSMSISVSVWAWV